MGQRGCNHSNLLGPLADGLLPVGTKYPWEVIVLLQYSYAGTATDLPLMEWLDHYTFPREAAHSHREVAEAEYRPLVQRTLGHGTTTAL